MNNYKNSIKGCASRKKKIKVRVLNFHSKKISEKLKKLKNL